jgi:uncharacterized membrane protein YccC
VIRFVIGIPVVVILVMAAMNPGNVANINSYGALAFVFGLYFVPSIIGRNKRNAQAILVLNVLAGWTVIGWIVALIWALTKEDEPLEVTHPRP